MMKTQIGLGVLSIPAVFDVLGIVPGVICLIIIAAITTWSDYMVGVFKRRHTQVYSIDDAGDLMFGRIGREILGIAFCLCKCSLASDMIKPNRVTDWIFVAGSGMLGISIGLNAVSTHGACTAIFVAVAAITGFSLASIRTLGRISWLAWIGLVCILTASKFPMTLSSPAPNHDQSSPSPSPSVFRIDPLLRRRPETGSQTTRSSTTLPSPRLFRPFPPWSLPTPVLLASSPSPLR